MNLTEHAGRMTASSEPPDFGELRTPVLLLVFNRPESTKAVLATIRDVRPSQLFVAADGPRPNVDGERQTCLETRRVATEIDWPCEVHTLFRDENRGVDLSVSSAIDWFFQAVEAGVILEDDCIPSKSFYFFCQELLSYYWDNTKVMHISGDNFQYGRKRGKASYYFSRYPFTWGWASWRRAWERYDFGSAAPETRKSTWDAQWHMAIEKYQGAAVVPNLNLVTNVGFGPGATHTTTVERFALLPAQEIGFPLIHPREVCIDRAADTLTYYANFRNIPDLRFMWAFQLWDFLYFRLKRLKQLVIKKPRPT